MRRGHLYSKAQKLGCNKIALGHHYDDVIETILMSMLYGGQIQTMMPKLNSTNFEGMQLIRPLYMVREDDIKGGVTITGCVSYSVPASSPTPAPPAHLTAGQYQSVWR